MHAAEQIILEFLQTNIGIRLKAESRPVTVYKGKVFTLEPLPYWVVDDDWPSEN